MRTKNYLHFTQSKIPKLHGLLIRTYTLVKLTLEDSPGTLFTISRIHRIHQVLLSPSPEDETVYINVSGWAFFGGVCNELRVSVIEDTFVDTTATVGAHELGHK